MCLDTSHDGTVLALAGAEGCTGWAKNGTVCVEHLNFVKH